MGESELKLKKSESLVKPITVCTYHACLWKTVSHGLVRLTVLPAAIRL